MVFKPVLFRGLSHSAPTPVAFALVSSIMLLAARSAALTTRTHIQTLSRDCAAETAGGCAKRMNTVVKAAETSNTVQALNVLGKPLQCCCTSPATGYYRDGFCRTGGGDYGVHTVCAQVTAEFLDYTRSMGNDLSSPAPHFNFPGLKPGDRWCLCAGRWKEAADAGKAPPVVLSGCHIRTLDFVDLDLLKTYAVPEEVEQQPAE